MKHIPALISRKQREGCVTSPITRFPQRSFRKCCSHAEDCAQQGGRVDVPLGMQLTEHKPLELQLLQWFHCHKKNLTRNKVLLPNFLFLRDKTPVLGRCGESRSALLSRVFSSTSSVGVCWVHGLHLGFAGFLGSVFGLLGSRAPFAGWSLPAQAPRSSGLCSSHGTALLEAAFIPKVVLRFRSMVSPVAVAEERALLPAAQGLPGASSCFPAGQEFDIFHPVSEAPGEQEGSRELMRMCLLFLAWHQYQFSGGMMGDGCSHSSTGSPQDRGAQLRRTFSREHTR